jgi:hypothetical protein
LLSRSLNSSLGIHVTNRWFFFIITVLFFLSSTNAECKNQMFSLERMVSTARYIVIGTVFSTEEYIDKDLNELCPARQKTIVSIEKLIKFDDKFKTIIVNTCTITPADDAIFKKGERCLLFIDEWNGNFRIVQGLFGKLIIKNNSISSLYIKDYEYKGEIKLNEFVKDIYEVLK